MKLSILTPTIPERLPQAGKLHGLIARQLKESGVAHHVEHLILCDNRARSIGAKRQALIDMARGDYVAFCDDDDIVRDGYVRSVLAAMAHRPDVITFHQRATWNGLESEVRFGLGAGDGPFNPDGITLRDAWHVCAWRRDVVNGCLFGESNYGEDLVWSKQARRRARTSAHVPLVLHEYHHDEAKTAAPVPT